MSCKKEGLVWLCDTTQNEGYDSMTTKGFVVDEALDDTIESK